MRTLRLLVIDEDSASRIACAEVFGELGCHVKTVGSGREALATLDGERFDLICLNPHLADGSSATVLARLEPGQFVVGLTADRANPPARFNGVIANPVTRGSAVITLLLARIAMAGGRDRPGQEMTGAAPPMAAFIPALAS